MWHLNHNQLPSWPAAQCPGNSILGEHDHKEGAPSPSRSQHRLEVSPQHGEALSSSHPLTSSKLQKFLSRQICPRGLGLPSHTELSFIRPRILSLITPAPESLQDWVSVPRELREKTSHRSARVLSGEGSDSPLSELCFSGTEVLPRERSKLGAVRSSYLLKRLTLFIT